MNDPIFFTTPAKLRSWLHKNHDKLTEQWIGFHRKDSGKPSITWSESVDEVLCYGWIDGVRHSHDETSYKIRFTPRKKNSIWSKVNLAKMDVLIASGKMMPAGLAIYEMRDPSKTNFYSFEGDAAKFDAESEQTFRENKKAWAFWETLPAYYRRVMMFRVTSAKKPETRERRLSSLIELCEKEERFPGMEASKRRK